MHCGVCNAHFTNFVYTYVCMYVCWIKKARLPLKIMATHHSHSYMPIQLMCICWQIVTPRAFNTAQCVRVMCIYCVLQCQHNMAYALTKREDLKLEVDESAGCDVCREVGLHMCVFVHTVQCAW